MINHHEDSYLFKGNSAIPLSSSILESTLLPRFRHISVASLVATLWSRFGSGSYSKVTSTLVNVCSNFSGFSVGFNPPPPKEAVPLGTHLLFTFALKHITYWESSSVQVNTTSIRSTIWGSDSDSRRFITIGITSAEAAELGLLLIQRNEVLYLYRILGVIFRSIFMHYTNADIDGLKKGKPTPTFKSVADIFNFKDKFLDMPLPVIMRYPYKYWMFSKEVWQVAPNLLDYSVQPELALYYFLFIARSTNTNIPSPDGLSKLLGISGDSGIVSVLKQSVLSFSQYLKSSSDYQFELVDLIAPNILGSMMYSAKNTLRLNRKSYLIDLEQNTVAFAEQLLKVRTSDEVSQALTPYADTAKSIILNDMKVIDKLLTGESK